MFTRFLAIFLLLGIFFSFACVKSPDPTIEDLVKTPAPTLQGASDRNYTTSSPPFILSGECSSISYGIQYSFNNSTWTEIPGGCPNNTFTISAFITARKDIWVRARTKNGATSACHAFVRLLLPPTSPAFTMVASSNSDDDFPQGTQNSINLNITGTTMSNAANKMHMGAVGIVYGQ